jgi:hydrogenase nickel incorporation protein HypA/HybF
MHELSIALNIVDLAQEEAERLGGVEVKAVHLRLGALSGVVKDSLLFSYEVACKETPLKGSRLVIEEVPVMVYCPCCQAERAVHSIQDFTCIECGAPASDIRQGRELEVVALEIQE